jgi:hypothetical protein
MKLGIRIIMSFMLACLASTPTTAASFSNGGVIILHSNLQLCLNAPFDQHLVVVATDAELTSLLHDFPGGINEIQITLESKYGPSTTVSASLQWVDKDQLVGQITLTGQPVQVLSRSYAMRRSWLPACE